MLKLKFNISLDTEIFFLKRRYFKWIDNCSLLVFESAKNINSFKNRIFYWGFSNTWFANLCWKSIDKYENCYKLSLFKNNTNILIIVTWIMLYRVLLIIGHATLFKHMTHLTLTQWSLQLCWVLWCVCFRKNDKKMFLAEERT